MLLGKGHCFGCTDPSAEMPHLITVIAYVNDLKSITGGLLCPLTPSIIFDHDSHTYNNPWFVSSVKGSYIWAPH